MITAKDINMYINDSVENKRVKDAIDHDEDIEY
jgi:hypothetical protein